MPERILLDNDEMTVTEVTSDDWPDAVGSTRVVRTDRKIPDPGDNAPDLFTLAAQIADLNDAMYFLITGTLEL